MPKGTFPALWLERKSSQFLLSSFDDFTSTWEETTNDLSVRVNCEFVALYHRKLNSGGNRSISLIILALLSLFQFQSTPFQMRASSTAFKVCVNDR